jgi:hypothetical protein
MFPFIPTKSNFRSVGFLSGPKFLIERRGAGGGIDFPAAFGKRDLHRLGKRFAERVVPISLTWGPLKVAKCEKTG